MTLARQLWFTAAKTVELRECRLDEPGPDEILVRTIYSGISAGTEMLVYRGQLPTHMALDTNMESMKNSSTSFPLQYGYASVGCVEAAGYNVNQEMIGRNIFALQPHATHYVIDASSAINLPENMDPLSAVFIANMETAVNLVLDARPMLGENVVILGQGVVGLLVSAILAGFPLSGRNVVDRIPLRRDTATRLGDIHAIDPDMADDISTLKRNLHGTPGQGADLVLELTGSPDALDLAVELCAYSGRIIVGSWYGNKPVKVDLGGRFHRDRIDIISSQVSTINPELTGRWDRKRRFTTALELLGSIKPEQMVTHRIAFAAAQEAYRLLDESPETVLQAVLDYSN